MSILPKATYRFNAVPIKLPMVFSIELEQIFSQLVCKYEKPRIAKAIYKFNAIPVKLPEIFFTELEQKISQCIWRHKSPEEPKQS